jgi:hypothetical protein
VATEIGLVIEEGNPQSRSMLESILALENTRNEAGSSICNHASCSGVAGVGSRWRTRGG